MAALSLGGSSVPVLTASRRRIATAVREQMFSGAQVTTRPGSGATRRVWSIEAGILTASAGATLLSTLEAAGTITATGDIIGGSLSVYATAIGNARRDLEDHEIVRFELVEVI